MKLGINGNVYWLSTGSRASWGAATDGIASGSAPADLTALKTEGDVVINLPKNAQKLNIRGNGGWVATVASQKDASIEITAVWDTNDDAQQALLQGWLTDATVPLAILDGDKATAGTQGLWADFAVTDFKKTEPGQGSQMATWTVAPGLSNVPPEWVEVGGS